MTVAKKNWATVQDKKMQSIKWLLPKKRSQTVAKNGTLQKWLWPKKSEPNSVGKKNAPYKNDSDQKNRNQTVENKKWHPIKMTVAKKNWATVQDKTMQFIKWLLPKHGAKQLKKLAPYKNDCGQRNLNQTA